MSVTRQPDAAYTLDEFLALEESAAEKHEYIDGRIYSMAGGTLSHNRICYNLAVATGTRLPKGCRGQSSDQMIYLEPIKTGLYPDLSIVCGEPHFADHKSRLLVNPRIIFEVLSPSTANNDKTWKWECYQQLDALNDYLLISQDKPQIEHYTRAEGDLWLYNRVSGISTEIRIASIDRVLPLIEIYDGIEFPPESIRPTIQIV